MSCWPQPYEKDRESQFERIKQGFVTYVLAKWKATHTKMECLWKALYGFAKQNNNTQQANACV